MKGLYKTLNINDLYFKDISSHRKKHHIGLRNGLFQGAIWCFSAYEIGFIA